MNDEAASRTVVADEARRRSRVRRGLRALQWAVNVAVVFVAVWVLAPGPDRVGQALLHLDPPAESDFILVLGGNNERAVEAARLYRDGLARKVIISSTGAEADALAEVAKAYGVPAGDIVLDRGPLTTRDHPETVARLPGVYPAKTKLLIVTSRRHSSRARAVFVKAGYTHIRFREPGWRLEDDRLPDRNWRDRLRDMPEEMYELLAWGWYWLRGWV